MRLVASAQQTKLTSTCTFVATWLKLLIYYRCPDINIVIDTHFFLPIMSILPLQKGRCRNIRLIQGGYFIHSRLYNSYHRAHKVQDYKLIIITVTTPPHLFLSTFAELRKATISFVTSVKPHQTTWLTLDGFSWNSKLRNFRKSAHKIQVLLKSDDTWRRMYIYDISMNSS